MSLIIPTRFIGVSVCAESTPLGDGHACVFRGVDFDPVIDAKVRRARGLPVPPGPVEPLPVIVREPGDEKIRYPELWETFQRVTRARYAMVGTAAPELYRVLDRGYFQSATVEEYVSGLSTAELLYADERAPRMPAEIALSIGRALCTLWTTAEACQPPVRFYLDPETVLVDARGQVRVLPRYAGRFEMASDPEAPVIPEVSIDYMPPEMMERNKLEARSGMYVLGVLLYEMLAGTHPFRSQRGGGMAALIAAVLLTGPTPLDDRRPALPVQVTDLVHRCLLRHLEARFPSWRELSRALGAAQRLYPPTSPADIARWIAAQGRWAIPVPPAAAHPSTWPPLSDEGYTASMTIEYPISKRAPGRPLRMVPPLAIPVTPRAPAPRRAPR